VAVSHCTGMQGIIELSKHFAARFMVASAGSVLDF
jgi:metal-dependent hydrolase (beta-lactamase superfamily II)